MTGRIAQFTPPVAQVPALWKPSWNLSPGQQVLILRKRDGALACDQVLWNLTPGWLKDLSRAPFSTNAEHLLDKPMYRQPLVERRCIIPVDGFFVWHQHGKRKQPWYLRRRHGGLALAGIWERYSLDENTFWDSCAVITTPAKGLPAKVGARMPVMLNAGEQAIWMAKATAPSALLPLLLNASSQVDMMYPVTTAVSSPATQGAHCCTPYGQIVTEQAPA